MKAQAKKVMVAGCFDLLHASHVVFLNKAAALGDLHVSLGSDQSIISQKNKSPAYSQNERKFLLENLRHVKWVGIPRDPGPLGFVEHLEAIRPDLFVINEDGDSSDKRAACSRLGIEYLVFPRDHFTSDAPTSTTQISKGSYIPTRVSLCSGFMDNPVFNGLVGDRGGHLVVLPIEPFDGMRERSGMATSTIKAVRKYFGCRLPTVFPVDRLAELIFCLENPPDKRDYISGTLDARGIVGNGANLFRYERNQFFPAEITTINDERTLAWLERHIYLKHSWDRRDDCVVKATQDHPDFRRHVEQMNTASFACWEAIRDCDLEGLTAAVRASHQSQSEVVANHCPSDLCAFIAREPASAAMIMGAGGGGYVAFIADSIPEDGIPIRIKRADY
jgi:cytidyltransferase-like protein